MSRRAARTQRERDAERAGALDTATPTPARHARARARRAARIGAVFALAAAGSLVMGSAAALTAAMTGPVVSGATGARLDVVENPVDASISAPPLPAPAASIPAPTVEAAPAVVDICAIPGVASAVAAGDDAAAIAAAGGAEAFRTAVASGSAACIPLDDPAHVWLVVNKTRPYSPIDYSPTSLAMPDGVRSVEGGSLRTDAAVAMTTLVAAAAQAGVGEVALESGYRSYDTQQGTYENNVGNEGAQADLSSARPGFSEHQSGLAADVVACDDGCGTLDDLAATPQGQWITAHAWEHGWITRYVEGATPISGYVPEPWHLRYIGPELAKAYHDGGWVTLEQFFGLPAAPDYLG